MSATKEEIYGLISTVVDPEVGFNLVELGLIYDAEISKDGKTVLVTMTLSTRGCPLHQAMVEWVQAAVKRASGVEECQVSVVWEPAWNISMAADHVRAALGG